MLNGSENNRTWAPVLAPRMGEDGTPIDPLEGVGGGGGDDHASCSCIEGNPCAVPYNCKDWANRFEIAKKAREGGKTSAPASNNNANDGRISPPSGMAGKREGRLFR